MMFIAVPSRIPAHRLTCRSNLASGLVQPSCVAFGPKTNPRYFPLRAISRFRHPGHSSRISFRTLLTLLKGHNGIILVFSIFKARAEISSNSMKIRCIAGDVVQTLSTTIAMSSAKAATTSSRFRIPISFVIKTSTHRAKRRPDKGQPWRTPDSTETQSNCWPLNFNMCLFLQ